MIRMSSDIPLKPEILVLTTSQETFKVDDSTLEKLLGAIKGAEYTALKDLPLDKLDAVRKLAPKVDKIDRSVLSIAAAYMLANTGFVEFKLNDEEDQIDLKNKEHIFKCNGKDISTLKEYQGINYLAYLAKINPCRYVGEKTNIIVDSKIKALDRFIFTLFGKLSAPMGVNREIDNMIYKWYKEIVQEEKLPDFSNIAYSASGPIARNYIRTVKNLLQKNYDIFANLAVKAIKAAPMKQFTFKKLEEDKVKILPVKRINFSISSSLKMDLKKTNYDLEKIGKIQEKISEISEYEKVKIGFKHLEEILNKKEILTKSLIQRSAFHNIVEMGKVKRTVNDQLYDRNLPHCSEPGIRIASLPYSEKIISDAISAIKWNNARIVPHLSRLKDLPKNVVNDIVNILGCEEIKSSKEDVAKEEFPEINLEEIFQYIDNNINKK